MTSRTIRLGLVLVGLVLAGAAAWWLQNRAPPSGGVQGAAVAQPPPSAAHAAGGPATVEAGRVEQVRLEDDAQAVGALRSRQGVMLRPEVSGRIRALPFKEGQRVKRGQLLVQLDDALPGAQLKQALAQESIARSNLQRSRELLAQGFVSQSAVDQAQSNLEVAEAQTALAQAQVARMKIVAPFDGVAGIRLVNLGDYVKDGADLVGIEDDGAVWVDFRLPERYIPRLRPGQPVEVTLDAMPGRRFSGRVDALDAQLDANGRSLLVRASLPNPGSELRSGMFARARIVFGVRENALLVP
jgi:membrane fusion protein (multidrug efflux system)